ncbi:hypothetical protein [Pseudooceanicola onchidii]|uniref:hypothetical protein n=1 Tax=Pseudooceanicola onchidii TaxID=2562279 RepID=UPI0010AB11F6|nr:hypothetical protein [Pseudooceanicola onchidii]
MIRPLVLSLLLAGPALSEGLDLSAADRAAFRAEVRAALLDDPSVIMRALSPDLYDEYAAQDRARLDDQAALFAPTDRGYGAEDPRLTVLFFEAYPCATCAEAWVQVDALLARHDDIRVEPRFAADSGAAQLLLSVLDREGIAAYRALRADLMAAGTQAELDAALDTSPRVQDRMLRPAPSIEAASFAALELQTAPSFVFPTMMVQGAVPVVVLEKYATR